MIRQAAFPAAKYVPGVASAAPAGAVWHRASAEFIMRLGLLFLFVAALPILASAQTDPLSPTYTPSIDTNAADYPANIWVTDTMTKVLQSGGSPGTSHWGTFYGTQGEFVDFQVHVQAPSGGYSALSVSSSNFVQSNPSSFTISASTRDVVVYREAYVPVTTITSTATTYYGTTGNYPDPLIPAVDPYFNQVTNAFPVAVAANQNQSAWIDVFIPNNAPSGYYLGSITVNNGSTKLTTLPIIIAVWQWPNTYSGVNYGGHMPATSSLPSELQYGWIDFCNAVYGTNNACSAYPSAGGSANNASVYTDMDGSVLFLDHRWTMSDPIVGSTSQYANLWNGNTSALPSAKPILQGATLTGQNDRGAFKLPSTTVTPQDFATFFGANKYPAGSTGSYPSVTPLWYTSDEPGSTASNWTAICNDATSAHSTSPAVATLATTEIGNMNANASTSGCTAQGVTNSLDIMVAAIQCLEPNEMYVCSAGEGGANPPIGYDRPLYNTWLSHTNPDGIRPMLWSYLACGGAGTCSNGIVGNLNYPNYNLDSKPAGTRAMEWMTYFHQQTGELYYYTTSQWESGTDPWKSVYEYGNNGDGTLVYPSAWCSNPGSSCSTVTEHVTQQSGAALTTPLWIPSVRMKEMRDGMQDYEYLNLLNEVGQGTFVTTEITSWITNSYTYDVTGVGLMAARKALGNKIHQLTYPAVQAPALSGVIQ